MYEDADVEVDGDEEENALVMDDTNDFVGEDEEDDVDGVVGAAVVSFGWENRAAAAATFEGPEEDDGVDNVDDIDGDGFDAVDATTGFDTCAAAADADEEDDEVAVEGAAAGTKLIDVELDERLSADGSSGLICEDDVVDSNDDDDTAGVDEANVEAGIELSVVELDERLSVCDLTCDAIGVDADDDNSDDDDDDDDTAGFDELSGVAGTELRVVELAERLSVCDLTCDTVGVDVDNNDVDDDDDAASVDWGAEAAVAAAAPGTELSEVKLDERLSVDGSSGLTCEDDDVDGDEAEAEVVVIVGVDLGADVGVDTGWNGAPSTFGVEMEVLEVEVAVAVVEVVVVCAGLIGVVG